MAEGNNTINFWWVEVNKDWLDGLWKSANTSLAYREKRNSKYKINPEHDVIWYTIRWWGNWPLQWMWDYFIKKIDNNRWEAIDSDWISIRIPDIFYYRDENGHRREYSNWNSIRDRALKYGNNKEDLDKITLADINTEKSNNINRAWEELNNAKENARANNDFARYQYTKFEYPYKDSKWNNIRIGRVWKRLIIKSPAKRRFK